MKETVASVSLHLVIKHEIWLHSAVCVGIVCSDRQRLETSVFKPEMIIVYQLIEVVIKNNKDIVVAHNKDMSSKSKWCCEVSCIVLMLVVVVMLVVDVKLVVVVVVVIFVVNVCRW